MNKIFIILRTQIESAFDKQKTLNLLLSFWKGRAEIYLKHKDHFMI